MKCPKCGFEQPQALECISCGIIIRKYNEHPMRPPPGSVPETQSPKDTSSGLPVKSFAVALLSLIIILYGAFDWWSSRPVSHGPGVMAQDPPEQTAPSTAPFAFKAYQVTPLADFHVNARVLSKKKYSFGRESDLAPIDLALGWGRMSDESVLQKLKIHQSNRFYFWSTDQFPIPKNEIETHSANMHLIPADSSVLKQIKAARTGDIVDFDGYLVQVTGEDNWKWKSSLSRNDTGNGACEVIFIEQFQIQ